MGKRRLRRLIGSEYTAAKAVAAQFARYDDRITLPRATATAYCREASPDPAFLPMMLDGQETQAGAWDTLSLIAQDLLRAGDPLPPELAAWAADALRDRCTTRPKRSGADPYQNHARDILIVTAITHLAERWVGYAIERKELADPFGVPESEWLKACERGGSICDAVGQAFDIEKCSTTARVWQDRRKIGALRRVPNIPPED